ncbi:tetratricopeptide repeat protein [Candidatus Vallotia tarda]|nr:tetratricopeptide repeat protein [Candidatus Vallotia tarda]
MNTTYIRIALALVSFLTNISFAQLPPRITDGTREPDVKLSQFNKRELEATLEQLDQQVFEHPSNAHARFKRANVLMQLGRDREAITAYTALTQSYPELPEPYNNLAALYAKRGKLDKARVLLETAVYASPGYALSQSNLGDLYIRLGVESFKHACALEPRDTYSARRTEQIEKLLSLPEKANAFDIKAIPPTTLIPPSRLPNFPEVISGTSVGPALSPYIAPKIIQP